VFIVADDAIRQTINLRICLAVTFTRVVWQYVVHRVHKFAAKTSCQPEKPRFKGQAVVHKRDELDVNYVGWRKYEMDCKSDQIKDVLNEFPRLS
jgi:hypothetical protein